VERELIGLVCDLAHAAGELSGAVKGLQGAVSNLKQIMDRLESSVEAQGNRLDELAIAAGVQP